MSMNTEFVCDECGEPIDTTAEYMTVSIATAGGDEYAVPTRLDYHLDHAPDEFKSPPTPA